MQCAPRQYEGPVGEGAKRTRTFELIILSFESVQMYNRLNH